ncbi:MAG: hypothetical protein Q7U63_13760 [Polaromonas sp.]|uniref:hypothetical protein n=1 Tax=Polaromonas sp. TaxID=1869339 RepID=UPI00271AFB5D|nr:hypothetical protein [Polaromonas sp.]MDO9114843.1 hypothetical protein [Polaromonas sp.]MDP1888740.1 hypothetical protein [Polaromonas sp.]
MVFRRMVWRAAWGYLALVLLLAPMLGQMHGLVHGAGGDRPAAQQHLEVDAHAHDHAHAHERADGRGWLADLFSVHLDDSDCRVFDQLCHSDVLPAAPPLALPMALSSFVFQFLEGEVLARRAALYEARGPPRAR